MSLPSNGAYYNGSWYDGPNVVAADMAAFGQDIIRAESASALFALLSWTTPEMYGAVGNNQAIDNTAALEQFWAACAGGKLGIIPSGQKYWCAQNVLWDLSIGNAQHGITILGAGGTSSQIAFSPGHGLKIAAQGPAPNSGFGVFYPVIRGLYVTGQYDNAPVLQLGQTDYSDAINDPDFQFIVQNGSTAAASVGTTMGWLLSGKADIVSNVGGTNGIAMQCYRPQLMEMRGGFGNAFVGLDFVGSDAYGNKWTSLDLEVLSVAIRNKVDAEALDNVFECGSVAQVANVLDWRFDTRVEVNRITPGQITGSYFRSPQSAIYDPTNDGCFGGVGVTLRYGADYNPNPPGQPVNGQWVDNKSGQLMRAFVAPNGESTTDCIIQVRNYGNPTGGTVYYKSATGAVFEGYACVLAPNEGINIAWSGAAPSLDWLPL